MTRHRGPPGALPPPTTIRAGCAAAGTGTGTPGRWCARSCSSSASWSSTRWSAASSCRSPTSPRPTSSTTICTKTITGSEDCKPNPNAGRVRRPRQLRRRAHRRASASSGCGSRTRSSGPSPASSSTTRSARPGRAAQPPVAGPQPLPGAADPAVGGAGVRQRLRLAVHVQPEVRAVQRRRWTASASTRWPGSTTGGPRCSPRSSPTSGSGVPFMMVALLGGLQTITGDLYEAAAHRRRLAVAALPQHHPARPALGQHDGDPARHHLDLQHVPGHLPGHRRRAGRRRPRSW